MWRISEQPSEHLVHGGVRDNVVVVKHQHKGVIYRVEGIKQKRHD